jgi:hypothetical protein
MFGSNLTGTANFLLFMIIEPNLYMNYIDFEIYTNRDASVFFPSLCIEVFIAYNADGWPPIVYYVLYNFF